jgi:hypothetical protein
VTWRFVGVSDDTAKAVNEEEVLSVAVLLVVPLEENEPDEDELEENENGSDRNKDFGEEKLGEATGLVNVVVGRHGDLVVISEGRGGKFRTTRLLLIGGRLSQLLLAKCSRTRPSVCLLDGVLRADISRSEVLK